MRILILLWLAAAPFWGCRSEAESERTAVDLGTPSDPRELAAVHFAAGRYAEAAEIYHQLVAATPDDPAPRASLAGALGALGKVDEARAELEKVIAADPLNSEAYHNRGVLHERKGDRDLAIEDYGRAVRYTPQYEPSRRALARLTGSADASPPQSAAEKLASAMAERASADAHKGDYDAALEKLAEAERIAPKLALVHQYRSNVAYLKGDRAGAIVALDKALALEPDNALFQINRKRLEKTAEPASAAATPAK